MLIFIAVAARMLRCVRGMMSSEQSLRLPIRLLPEAAESVLSWAVRTCEANGYRNPRWILERVGLSGEKTQARKRVLTNLNRMVECDSLVFDRMLPKRHDKFTAFNILKNVKIPNNLLDYSSNRIWPSCLNDNKYARIAWNLRFLDICPRHRVRIITRCPFCGEALSWYSLYINRCAATPSAYDVREAGRRR